MGLESTEHGTNAVETVAAEQGFLGLQGSSALESRPSFHL